MSVSMRFEPFQLDKEINRIYFVQLDCDEQALFSQNVSNLFRQLIESVVLHYIVMILVAVNYYWTSGVEVGIALLEELRDGLDVEAVEWGVTLHLSYWDRKSRWQLLLWFLLVIDAIFTFEHVYKLVPQLHLVT